MAEELKFPAVVIGVFVAYYLVVWVFPSISHEISGRELRIRWRILWRIPFGTRRIRIDDIQKAEVVGLVPADALWRGRLFSIGGVLLTLRAKRWGRWRRFYITPRDPHGFVRELEPLLAPPEPQFAARRPFVRLHRPLWVTDAIVATCALIIIAFGLLWAIPQFGDGLFRSIWSTVLPIAAAALVLATVVWLWADSVQSAARAPQTRRVPLALWTCAIIVMWPVAVLYYLLEYRPRRRARTRR